MRALFFHAHPDDESITTGGTMAALVAAGHEVTLVTSTRGEAGEVIGDQVTAGDRVALAARRERELAAAMAVLGVQDHRFLGDVAGGRRFEDSGMQWSASGLAAQAADQPRGSLAASRPGEPAEYMARIIADVKPHLVVTYGPGGGYGHPDHTRTHDEVLLALQKAAAGGWMTPRVALIEEPRDVAQARFDSRQPGFAETGFAALDGLLPAAEAGEPDVVSDVIDWIGAKAMAMSRHGTQMRVAGEYFALSNGVGQRIGDREYFRVAAGVPVPNHPAASLLEGLSEEGLVGAAQAPAPAVAPAARPVREPRPPSTAYTVAHSVVLTLMVGIVGTFQHLNAAAVMGVVVPWGLILAMILVLAAQWHVGMAYRRVYPMMIVGFGVSTIAYVLAQAGVSPNQDLVVTGSLRSLAWLFLPLVTSGVLAFAMPRRFRVMAARESPEVAKVP